MKDDFLNKIKSMLSGSNQVNNDDKPAIDEDLVSNFMNQILESAWVEDDLRASCAPSYHLSKKNKSYWLMNNTIKTLVSIKGGIEIVPIEAGEKNTTCLIGQSLYTIPNQYIICSGWN